MNQLVVGSPAADKEDEAHQEAQALQAHAAHPWLVNVDGSQKVTKVGNKGVQQGPLKHLHMYAPHRFENQAQGRSSLECSASIETLDCCKSQ